MKKNVAKFG